MTDLKGNALVQFSLLSLVIMAVMAAILAIALSTKVRADAIDDVVNEAVGVSSMRLLRAITPEDLETPMTGERYNRFHEFVQESIVSDRTARVKLWAKDGTVIYADDPRGVGEKFPGKANLLKALDGENAIETKIPDAPENALEKHLGTLMEVYTPIIFEGSTEPLGAFEIYQYYGPTAGRINHMRTWIFLSIGVGFLLLYGGLVSIFWRNWSTIVRQRSQLQSFNTDLEEQIQQRTAALQAANNEMEAFSYSVSHDLRAPLRAIDGFSLALLEDHAEQLDDEGKDYLYRVRLNSQRMSELIDDLLQLSRGTRNKMRHETVDLSALAQSISTGLQQRDPQREATAAITEGLTTMGDPGLLRTMMENLMGNAWKYTRNRPNARIEFGSIQQDGTRAYFLRDDGTGFDMTYVDKLFRPFQRLHTADEFEGTGIGLAIVQRIVHRHGGIAWAESQQGHGATFYFTLNGSEGSP